MCWCRDAKSSGKGEQSLGRFGGSSKPNTDFYRVKLDMNHSRVLELGSLTCEEAEAILSLVMTPGYHPHGAFDPAIEVARIQRARSLRPDQKADMLRRVQEIQAERKKAWNPDWMVTIGGQVCAAVSATKAKNVCSATTQVNRH